MTSEENSRNSVLIVDDEYHVGILIEKLIHWDELRMECVGKATNGEAAFEMICELHPDVVITDVRMPKVTGLDLIQMVQEKLEYSPNFIIVSGYKEFEYAHQAILYGVENYILKPVNELELNQTLEKIRKKIDERTAQKRREESMQQSRKENEYRIKQDFLKNIIEQETVVSSEAVSAAMHGDHYMGIDVKMDYINYKQFDTRQDELLIRHIKQIVQTALEGVSEELLICEKEHLHLYCLINYQADQDTEVTRSINEALSRIQEYLLGFEQYVVTIGIGNPRTGFADIRYSILEATKAVCERLRCGTGRLIYFREHRDISEKFENGYRQLRREILKMAGNMEAENLSESLETWLNLSCQDDTLEMFVLYDRADRLVDAFFAHLEYDEEKKEQAKNDMKAGIQHCFRISQMVRVLSEGMCAFVDNARKELQSQSVLPVRKAIEYVEQHFKEKILLEDVAALVDLNPVYFSTLFKKETGMNFSAYLIEVRMEKAKALLISTNETVAAIGDSVGYSDQKYFSQVFKKAVGVKPIVYRKMHA